MTDFGGLRGLIRLINRLESDPGKIKLTVLSREEHQRVAEEIRDELLTFSAAEDIQVETRTGEYLNEIAIIHTGKNKYTLSQDYQGPHFSEINRYACRITPETAGLLVFHTDSPGIVHEVSKVLAHHKINISSMNLSREQKGRDALLVSLTDEPIPTDVITSIQNLPRVDRVLSLH
ncbi:hypothetical protein BEP19_16435 [Ammoniphilus oxalaticus]|uniref:ACT domain-containing protein n=1 Tax=Ammoniphilus oxalaticus TaxID=66863 RepID=A0A419SQV0_9BACL|nr:ACT domain-containing protein [Ammoniphilus oxalaticus]RKD26785.1 hypothetical protein BEP19_16435 [Ammoniphilus oxalaticus]